MSNKDASQRSQALLWPTLNDQVINQSQVNRVSNNTIIFQDAALRYYQSS